MAREKKVASITEAPKAEVEEQTPEEQARDMSDASAKMDADRVNKIDSARDSLHGQCCVQAEKYLTASGIISTLGIIREVCADRQLPMDDELELAREIACDMSDLCTALAERLVEAEPSKMEDVLDELYNHEFAKVEDTSTDAYAKDLVMELSILNLCQQVGPACQDIAQFDLSAREEIAKNDEALAAFCKEHKIEKSCLLRKDK